MATPLWERKRCKIYLRWSLRELEHIRSQYHPHNWWSHFGRVPPEYRTVANGWFRGPVFCQRANHKRKTAPGNDDDAFMPDNVMIP